MREIKSNIQCPVCQGSMEPKILGCKQCGITIKGNFLSNEFSSLEEDYLHFLRVFIHCEGKISDMEKALGVSYPTVKATMSKLREKLNLTEYKPDKNLKKKLLKNDSTLKKKSLVIEELEKLESGEIDFKNVIENIKK